MKYQQPDDKTLTSCKNCVLAVYEGDTQTTCLANRIDKIDHIEAHDEDKEFYVMQRFCNYYRANSDDYMKGGEPDIDKIREESLITFDLFIMCDNIDNDYLNNTIDLYQTILNNYQEKKISIHLLYKNINSDQKSLVKRLKEETGDSLLSYYSNDIFLHSTILKSTSSYHIIISKEKFPKKNIFNRINDLINEDLKKIIVYENNVCAISNLAYKITSIQNSSYNYSDNISKIINQSKDKELYYNE